MKTYIQEYWNLHQHRQISGNPLVCRTTVTVTAYCVGSGLNWRLNQAWNEVTERRGLMSFMDYCREATSSSAAGPFICIRWHSKNPNVHYRVHNNPPLDTALDALTPFVFNTHFNRRIFLPPPPPGRGFPSRLGTKHWHAFLIPSMLSIFPAHPTLFVFITVIIFDKRVENLNFQIRS